MKPIISYFSPSNFPLSFECCGTNRPTPFCRTTRSRKICSKRICVGLTKKVNSSFFREIIFEKINVKSTFWKQVGRVAFFKEAHHKEPFLYLFKKMSKDMDTFSRSFDISIWRMHYTFLQKSSSFIVPGIVVCALMIKCSFACRPSEFK